MGAINSKAILQAAESILDANLPGYKIERNPVLPQETWAATVQTAWIGIYAGDIEYNSHTVGGSPWLVDFSVMYELQIASFNSWEDAEDRMNDAMNDLIAVLDANQKLNNTVAHTKGYSVRHMVKREEQTYYFGAIITQHTEIRA